MHSRPNGFVSFDTLFASLPALLIVMYSVSYASALSGGAESALSSQYLFDKLVIAADYLVNHGLAVQDATGVHPNWVNDVDLAIVAGAGADAGLSFLHASLDSPPDSDATCIYRIISYGDEKSIRKLYFCGG